MSYTKEQAHAYYMANRERKKAWQTNYRATHREQVRRTVRNSHLKRTYGITSVDFDALLAAQGGRCAICRADEPRGQGTWHVDHDHASGVVRGLLCHTCNRHLLPAIEGPHHEAAVRYLETQCPTT